MKSLMQSLPLLSVLFVVQLTVCGYSQVDDDDDFSPGGRFAAPDINTYPGLFLSQGNTFGFSVEQIVRGNSLIKSAMEDSWNSYRTAEQRHQLMLEITSDFSPEQMLLFRQHVRISHYQAEVGKHYPELAPKLVPKGNFYWLHPEVADLLGIQASQKNIILSLCVEFAQRFEGANSQVIDQYRDIFAQWQEKLHEVLLPRQAALYEEATGTAISFETSVQEMFRFAYTGKVGNVPLPLCLRKGETARRFQGDINPLHLLLIGEQRLDGQMNFHAETHLLQTDTICKELKLTESQLKQIKKLQEEYEENHPLPQTLAFGFRQRGIAFTPTSVPGPDAKVRKDYEATTMDESEKQIDEVIMSQRRRLLSILDSDQRTRWQQIQNQLVLGFGWKEVPLTFPDWPSYLELSSEQAEEFESIHVEMETRFGHAQKFFQDQLQLERKKLQGLPDVVLTPQQKAKLVLMFGKFAGFQAIE